MLDTLNNIAQSSQGIDWWHYVQITGGAITGLAAVYYYLWGRHLANDFTRTNFVSRMFAFLRQKPSLSTFFTTIKSPKINYVIYQFGLRPYLPLIDILYLEYLHSLVKKGEIEKIIIFPSIDLSSPTQDGNAYTLLQENVKKIFKTFEARIIFNNPFTSHILSNRDLTSQEFLETIKYIGSTEYFNYLKTEWKSKVASYNDFNRYHPTDTRLLVTFTHLFWSWQVYKHLKEENIITRAGSSTLDLGFIFWETEVDKLGVFKKIAEDNSNVKLSIILGKTILDKKKKPIPVFEPNFALNLFQKITTNFDKINNSPKNVIRKNISILEVILRDNYSFSQAKNELIEDGKRIFEQEIKSNNIKRIDLKYPKQSYTLISLLNKLMNIYSNGK